MARLTKDNTQRARELIALYPDPKSALLPLLHLAQEQDGWLQADAMVHIAELLDITPAEVLSTASFYTMYKRTPTGTHLVSVCTNVACMMLGGYELLEHAEGKLGIKAGATTPDGKVTLEEVECLAACDQAPCLQVNYRYFGPLDTSGLDSLLDDISADRLTAIPPHGTLSRVRRDGGLRTAGGTTTDTEVIVGDPPERQPATPEKR